MNVVTRILKRAVTVGYKQTVGSKRWWGQFAIGQVVIHVGACIFAVIATAVYVYLSGR